MESFLGKRARQSVRLAGAMACSVCLHILLAAAPGELRPHPSAGRLGTAAISVRLVPSGSSVAIAPALPPADASIPRASPASAERSAHRIRRAQDSEPQVYDAAALDVLPRLLRPLVLRLPDSGDGGEILIVRLEVVIDSAGTVKRARVMDGVARDASHAIEAAIEATPFIPARRNGRTVAARVALAVTVTR